MNSVVLRARPVQYRAPLVRELARRVELRRSSRIGPFRALRLERGRASEAAARSVVRAN